MGVDITMHIVDADGEFINRDIFYTRNSDWFRKLQYGFMDLPIHTDVINLPKDVIDDIEDNHTYYNYRHINVGEYKTWFNLKHPDVDAGWVTKREAWLYNTKDIVPNLLYSLDYDCIVEDMEFIEVIDRYCCFRWLYNYVITNEISNDSNIVYYFDC